MKPVTLYQSIDGAYHERPEHAILRDFQTLKDRLSMQVRFLNISKDEKQFHDIHAAFEGLFHKWQEVKNMERDVKVFKHKTMTKGIISQGRIERQHQHSRTLKKVA